MRNGSGTIKEGDFSFLGEIRRIKGMSETELIKPIEVFL